MMHTWALPPLIRGNDEGINARFRIIGPVVLVSRKPWFLALVALKMAFRSLMGANVIPASFGNPAETQTALFR
jgi:hypothetical protein